MSVDRVARLRPQPYPVSKALAAPARSATSDPAPRGKSDIPKVPDAVARVIEAGVLERRLLFPESGGSRVVERWQPVAIFRNDVLEELRAHLGELETALQPADRGALLARLLALLSHYRAEPNPPQVEQMMADDWAEDLGEFPMWAIEDACRAWRRTRKWKPQIVEVLALCRDAVGDAAQRRDRLRAVVEASTAARNPLSERVRMVAATTFRRVPS